MPAADNNIFVLFSATALGAMIGLNRQMHHKPAGLRTNALVSLGAAMAALLVLRTSHGDASSASRVLQGVVTGIGFLGAGVIMHHDAESRVEGLTTAASVWISAMIGLACGIGLILEAGVVTAITIAVLSFGGRVEHFLARLIGRDDDCH